MKEFSTERAYGNSYRSPQMATILEESRQKLENSLASICRNFIQFPAESNQKHIQQVCTDYRLAWMRAGDPPGNKTSD